MIGQLARCMGAGTVSTDKLLNAEALQRIARPADDIVTGAEQVKPTYGKMHRLLSNLTQPLAGIDDARMATAGQQNPATGGVDAQHL